jgi:Fe-S-cluster formation regulator IscX/YfhJ
MEGVDPNIVAFADAARRFCTLVEGASFEEPFNLDAIRKRLADLHARVLELPALGCGDVDAPDIPPEMWQRFMAGLSRFR